MPNQIVDPKRPCGMCTVSARMEQTESQFADAVIGLATLLGWKVKRDPTWRPTAAAIGFPDLVLVRAAPRDPFGYNGPSVIFAELKRDSGRVTAAQRAWLDAVNDAAWESVEKHNLAAVVWRPKDWPEVEAVLKGERCARCAYTERELT